jgi:hypothetical protein
MTNSEKMQDLKTCEFIIKAKKLHGEKFDYSRVEYVNSTTPVLIECPDHGVLWQVPTAHLRKRKHGCKECGRVWQSKNTLRKRTEEFFKRCEKKHADKFDYSKTVFNTLDGTIEYVCPKHGHQQMQAGLHLGEEGCRECALEVKIELLKFHRDQKQTAARENFKQKASKKHKDFYDYSKVDYVNNSTLIDIICPIHGQFSQQPNNHLHGSGCEPCGIARRADKKRKSLEDFIAEAKAVHGEAYDYRDFKYETTHTPGIIICSNPDHKPTPITPAHHLGGQGCSECGEEKRDKWRRSSGHDTESWIAKARQLHGDRYDYSQSEYTGYDCAITIECDEHGLFVLEPAHQHIETERRRGCGECTSRESTHSIAIGKWLTEKEYDFIKEWSHPECRDVKVLRFDYFLPDFNTCIEYDGDQHFRLGPWGHDDEDIQYRFIKGRRRDAIKSLWCIDNSVRLVRVTSKIKLKEIDAHLASIIPSTLGGSSVDIEYPKDDQDVINEMSLDAYLKALIYWGGFVDDRQKSGLNWLDKVPGFVLGKKRPLSSK